MFHNISRRIPKQTTYLQLSLILVHQRLSPCPCPCLQKKKNWYTHSMQEVAYFRKKEKKVLKADWLITSAYAGYLFIWKPEDLPLWLQVLFLFLKILSLLFHPSRSYPMKHGIKLINEMEELKRSEEKLMNDVTKNCQNVFKQTLFWVFYYMMNN